MNIDYNKYIRKLESDLSEYIISEVSPPNPEQRKESEIYKYKGLMLLSIDPRVKRRERTFLVRIGTLEAEFSLNSGEKIIGGIGALEEKLVHKWFNMSDNAETLQTVYRKMTREMEQEKEIVPFGMDDFDDDD